MTTMVNGYLSKEQVYEIVSENQYSFPEFKFRGRCFSGEFKNSFHLPALALPGGDLGELAILLSTAVSYGFEININKAAEELFQLTGGNEHLSSSIAKSELSSCAYFKHLFSNTASYNLNEESLEIFYKQVKHFLPDFQVPKDRSYTHEHAVLILEASQGLYPQYTLETYEGSFESRILVFHKTLVDLRHKELSRKLVEKKIVTLYDDLDADYLYEVLSETAETHLYETIRFIDPKLPIYSVTIDAEGDISVELL